MLALFAALPQDLSGLLVSGEAVAVASCRVQTAENPAVNLFYNLQSRPNSVESYYLSNIVIYMFKYC